MFSNVHKVRYIDSERDGCVFEQGIAGVPRLPNIGERIIDRDYEGNYFPLVPNVPAPHFPEEK